MQDWKEYWNDAPRKFSEEDFLLQVGKTKKGVPINDEQINSLLNDITNKLNLESTDRVIDLCCANGFITRRIADRVESIVGIDYSEPLIEVAKKFHMAENLEYHCMSVMDLSLPQKFSKVYMYEALQHFALEDLDSLLRLLRPMLDEEHLILFASIPDKSKVSVFYDTEEKMAQYEAPLECNRSAIGTWWEKELISDIAEKNGYRCAFTNQSPNLHTADYRFDVVLSK